MALKTDILIDASLDKVWSLISDIKGSPEFISGIDKVEILEQPAEGLVGLKWEETRTLFGRTATEVMWITDVEPGRFYKTRADGPNVVYISSLGLDEVDGKTRLTMQFESDISSLGTRILSAVMGIFFNGATRKAMEQDLKDIKAVAEGA